MLDLLAMIGGLGLAILTFVFWVLLLGVLFVACEQVARFVLADRLEQVLDTLPGTMAKYLVFFACIVGAGIGTTWIKNDLLGMQAPPSPSQYCDAGIGPIEYCY